MEETAKKPTYEQLEQTVINMHRQLDSLELTKAFKRADYLLEVMKNKESFTLDFVNRCREEFEDFLTVKE